jgi:hypothetical protein
MPKSRNDLREIRERGAKLRADLETRTRDLAPLQAAI